MISTLLLLAPALALAVPLPKVITTNNIPPSSCSSRADYVSRYLVEHLYVDNRQAQVEKKALVAATCDAGASADVKTVLNFPPQCAMCSRSGLAAAETSRCGVAETAVQCCGAGFR